MGSLLEPIAGIVDTAFVGRLGPVEIGALGISVSIFNSFFWVFNFLIHIPMENASKGSVEGREKLIVQAQVGLSISILVGVLSFLFLYTFSESLLFFAGADSSTINEASKYFNIRILGQPLVLTYFCLLSILRGFGKAKISLVPIAISILVNIVISYFLIFHYSLSIAGAAYGTLISQIIGLGVICLLVWKYMGKDVFILRKLSLALFTSFSKKSLFLFCRSFILTSIFFFSTKVAASFGVLHLSSFQIGLQFWLFSSFFVDGVAMVGNIESAKLKALKNRSEFILFCQNLFTLSFYLGCVFAAVYFFFSAPLIKLFTENPAIQNTLGSSFFIIALGQIVNALAFSIDGVFFGLGGYRRLAKMMMLNFFFCYVPLTLLSVSYSNIQVLWVALAMTSIFRWFYLKRLIYQEFDHIGTC